MNGGDMSDPIQRGNFHVLTGGPGAGKTSLIHALAARGFATVPESGRAIIMELNTNSHGVDPVSFAAACTRRDIANYDAAPLNGSVFFDHSCAGAAGYGRMGRFEMDADLLHEARRRRFNRLVFAAPPWREIYVNDEQRRQTWDEALRVHEVVRAVYLEGGYEIVELPKDGVEVRVRFVLERIGA